MRKLTAMSRFIQNAERLRVGKGLSIQALADEIGMVRPQLSNVLSGKNSPTLDTMERIAAGLEVDVLDLLQQPSKELAAAS